MLPGTKTVSEGVFTSFPVQEGGGGNYSSSSSLLSSPLSSHRYGYGGTRIGREGRENKENKEGKEGERRGLSRSFSAGRLTRPKTRGRVISIFPQASGVGEDLYASLMRMKERKEMEKMVGKMDGELRMRTSVPV